MLTIGNILIRARVRPQFPFDFGRIPAQKLRTYQLHFAITPSPGTVQNFPYPTIRIENANLSFFRLFSQIQFFHRF